MLVTSILLVTMSGVSMYCVVGTFRSPQFAGVGKGRSHWFQGPVLGNLIQTPSIY